VAIGREEVLLEQFLKDIANKQQMISRKSIYISDQERGEAIALRWVEKRLEELGLKPMESDDGTHL
jgi:hypothetical protein